MSTLSCLVPLEVLVVVVGVGAGIARAAPASMGESPRMIREVVERGSSGRTHSGIGSSACMLAVILLADGSGSEVVPLDAVEVEVKGGGVSSATGLAKYRTRVVYAVRHGGQAPFAGLGAEQSKMRASEASPPSGSSLGGLSFSCALSRSRRSGK